MPRSARTAACLIITSIIIFAPSISFADDDYVTFAKSLLAKDFDSSLPSMPIEQWLSSVLPQGIVAVWGSYITDCGEQTGNPAVDRERDMPLCAKVELKQKEKPVGYLLLFVGTERKGKLKKSAGLYYGSIEWGGKTVWFKKLSELANIE